MWLYTCTYVRILMNVWGKELDPLTATLPLIWTAGRGESRERFDDFDGLVRTADWLPPTSCRTFDEIQTFGPIPSAGCGYRGPRNGVVYSATTVDAPWIPEDECPKREIGKLDNWRARWSDKRPPGFTREANRPAVIDRTLSDFEIEAVYDQRGRIYIHDSHNGISEKKKKNSDRRSDVWSAWPYFCHLV